MTKFFTILGAFAGIVTALPAFAEPLSIETAVVKVADLDLSSAAGQRALEARINRAVIAVCGAASDVDLEGLNAVRACRAAKLVEARSAGEQRLAFRSTDVIQLAGR
jgi:UrcA family protein